VVLTFLYWNFNCAAPEREVIAARVALQHEADVLILDETRTDAARVVDSLRARDGSYCVALDLPNGPRTRTRLQVISSFPSGHLVPTPYYTNHTRVCELSRPGCQAILLALVHLKSRLSFVGDQNPVLSQQDHAEFEYSLIRDAENNAGHMRTIVVGDFNMNPFEPGMIAPERGFGAMMCRGLAVRHCPTSTKEDGARRFYNPLWSRMGLDLPSPPGTYSGATSATPSIPTGTPSTRCWCDPPC
jgi:hypothetical protein